MFVIQQISITADSTAFCFVLNLCSICSPRHCLQVMMFFFLLSKKGQEIFLDDLNVSLPYVLRCIIKDIFFVQIKLEFPHYCAIVCSEKRTLISSRHHPRLRCINLSLSHNKIQYQRFFPCTAIN